MIFLQKIAGLNMKQYFKSWMSEQKLKLAYFVQSSTINQIGNKN